MDNATLVSILEQAVLLCLLLSGVPLIASVSIGTLTSILQAATQIQEQTLSFVPKLISICVVIYFAGPWLASQLLEFTIEILESLGEGSGRHW